MLDVDLVNISIMCIYLIIKSAIFASIEEKNHGKHLL